MKVSLWVTAVGMVLSFSPKSASASIVYGSDLSGYMGKLDLVSGVMTKLPQKMDAGLVHGLAYDPVNERMFGVTAFVGSSRLVSIDLTTGADTVIGTVGSESTVAGLAFNSDNGYLYGTTTSGYKLLKINPTTGASSTVGLLKRSVWA